MVDMASVGMLLGTLKTAGDIAKTVMDLKDGLAVQTKVIELQAVIMSAQSGALAAQRDQSSLIARVSELEKEVASLKGWNTEASGYELKQIDISAFAYMPKPNANGAEPPHWLCQNCFDHKHKSVLQPQGKMPDKAYTKYACQNCRATLALYYRRQPSVPYVQPVV